MAREFEEQGQNPAEEDEQMRAELPNMIERRKREEVRLFGIARKYFHIWLNNVRRRRNAIRDDNHTSIWIKGIAGTMDRTLDFLRFQTGTETKLDAFIVNIIRLKSAIKKQLELEGGEGTDEDEDEDSDGHDEKVAHLVKPRPTASKNVIIGDTDARARRSSSASGDTALLAHHIPPMEVARRSAAFSAARRSAGSVGRRSAGSVGRRSAGSAGARYSTASGFL